ncbi:hypothetical protein B0H14DRAFT_3442475 [Mycena olivaceomarginata]|nr:hypothetical protein B0H14DRAFT_3442475 [Mycena olivaceomarginata]
MRLPPCSGVANTNEPQALGLLNRSSGLRRVLEIFAATNASAVSNSVTVPQ